MSTSRRDRQQLRTATTAPFAGIGFGIREEVDTVELGQRIQRLRVQRGISRRKLAELVARSERWVWNLEHGRTSLDRDRAEALATALQVDVTLLLGLEDEVKRRDFLRRAMAGAAGAALIPAASAGDQERWDRLGRLLQEPSGVDQATIDHLEHALTALEALEYDVAPVALVGPMRASWTR